MFTDPGSSPNFDCNADKPIAGITLHMIEDWESGAGIGWYTNNDVCEPIQTQSTDKILGSEAKGVVGAIDAGSLPPGNAETIDAGIKTRNQYAPECLAAQWPSYFAKPVPADKIQGDGRCGSKYAFHVIAGPFFSWGGQLGLNLYRPRCVAPPCVCNDATLTQAECDANPDFEKVEGGPYDGIAFWARVVPNTDTKQSPNSGQAMSIQVKESHTDFKYPLPVNGEPPCKDNTGKTDPNDTTGGCDAFGSFAVLNNDWQFFALPFEEMRQAGWGKKAPFFDIQHISNLTFFYGQGIWDIWIDDIAYYKRSAQ